MDEGVSIRGVQKSGLLPGRILDAEEFARAIRGLAIEARETLNRPDATVGELIELRRRFRELIRVPRGSRLTEIDRWLRSAYRRLDARLLSDLRIELGHWAG
jgi:hypothetical protein